MLKSFDRTQRNRTTLIHFAYRWRLKPCPHWQSIVAEFGDYRRLPPFSATIAEFGDSRRFPRLLPKTATNCRWHSRRKRRLSTNSATVTEGPKSMIIVASVVRALLEIETEHLFLAPNVSNWRISIQQNKWSSHQLIEHSPSVLWPRFTNEVYSSLHHLRQIQPVVNLHPTWIHHHHGKQCIHPWEQSNSRQARYEITRQWRFGHKANWNSQTRIWGT